MRMSEFRRSTYIRHIPAKLSTLFFEYGYIRACLPCRAKVGSNHEPYTRNAARCVPMIDPNTLRNLLCRSQIFFVFEKKA